MEWRCFTYCGRGNEVRHQKEATEKEDKLSSLRHLPEWLGADCAHGEECQQRSKRNQSDPEGGRRRSESPEEGESHEPCHHSDRGFPGHPPPAKRTTAKIPKSKKSSGQKADREI